MNRVRKLNDQFRTTMSGGRVLVTPGVAALPPDLQVMAVRKVATFDAFTDDNDPHGEHDFGAFELAGRRLFWKIDLYEDPDVNSADGTPVVGRVLTIMLADEY